MSDLSNSLIQTRDWFAQSAKVIFPGFLLSCTIAGAATFLSEHYATPVMLLALLIGMAFNFLSEDEKCQKGIEFSSKPILRIGIVLLGARITLTDIASLGFTTFLVIICLIAFTILSGFIFAKFLNKDWCFALLTGGSVAICGASAAMAITAVLPKNDKLERNTLFTVIAVTTFSTIAMVLYPILFTYLDLSEKNIGFLIGATIHDVAQVIGAGYSISVETGDIATIVKLLRVSMLPVVLIVIILLLPKTTEQKDEKYKTRLPLFVLGFLFVVLANSSGFIPQTVQTIMIETSRWFLVIAIAALGVKTSMQKMLQLGYGHVGIIFFETITLLVAAILAVKFFEI